MSSQVIGDENPWPLGIEDLSLRHQLHLVQLARELHQDLSWFLARGSAVIAWVV